MTRLRRPKHLALVPRTPGDPAPPQEDARTVYDRLIADPLAYDDHEDTLEEDLARECGIADLAPAARQAVYARAYIQGHSAAEVAEVYPELAVIARVAWDAGVAAERQSTEQELLALRELLLTLPKCEHPGCKKTATRSYANAPGRTPVSAADAWQAQGPAAPPARPLAHEPRIRRVDQPRRAGVRRASRVRRERRDLVRPRAGHHPAVERRAGLRRRGRVRVGQPGLPRAERRCVVTAPWCDCPPCASCGTEVGIPTTSDGSPLPPPWLWCPACGHRWQASDEDRAKADRAQAAWDRHQDEEKAGAL